MSLSTPATAFARAKAPKSLIIGIVVRVLIRVLLFLGLGRSLLGRLLLLLLVLRLGAAGLRQGNLEDLEKLLVRDLLVALPFGKVRRWRSGQPLQTVLRDGLKWSVQRTNGYKGRRPLTNRREQSANGLAVIGSHHLILTHHTSTDALHNSDLASTLVLKLP